MFACSDPEEGWEIAGSSKRVTHRQRRGYRLVRKRSCLPLGSRRQHTSPTAGREKVEDSAMFWPKQPTVEGKSPHVCRKDIAAADCKALVLRRCIRRLQCWDRFSQFRSLDHLSLNMREPFESLSGWTLFEFWWEWSASHQRLSQAQPDSSFPCAPNRPCHLPPTKVGILIIN